MGRIPRPAAGATHGAVAARWNLRGGPAEFFSAFLAEFFLGAAVSKTGA